MIRKIFLTVAATLVAVTGLFAQELPDDPEVRKGVLDNGMTYYIRHNNKPANQAEFWIFDNVGHCRRRTPSRDSHTSSNTWPSTGPRTSRART